MPKTCERATACASPTLTCLGICRYSDVALARMCDDGVRRYKEEEYDRLKFDLLNLHEWVFVGAYMGIHHPGVPFQRTKLFN